MNVLFVCEGLNNLTAVAQPWRHVVEISKRIQDLGNSVQIFSDYQERLNPEDEIAGVPIRRFRKNGFLFNVEELQKGINQEDFDIINWHGSDTWSSFHLWRLRKRTEKNIVWTLHSGPLSVSDFKNLGLREAICLHEFWNNLLNTTIPAHIVRKWVNIPQLKHIIVLSKRLSNHLGLMKIGKDKIDVIPSGVDTSLFRPAENRVVEQLKQSLGFEGNERLILYFGPLSTFRGIDTLIAAMPTIQNRLPNVRLVVLGRTQEVKNESWFMRTRATPVIGLLKQEILIQYMSIADVVVLPFKFWPQVECPLTVLESMAMEKPLITTWVGAIPEVVRDGENGILVPPKNPKEIADKVVLLLQDKSLSMEIGKKAREHVETFFDWGTIVQKTMAIFNQVISNN